MTAAAVSPAGASGTDCVVRLADVSVTYGRVKALDRVSLAVPAGRMVGLIGPDGVGKSTLLSLAAGARAIQDGRVTVLGGHMADGRHRRAASPQIAYMPQGLGRNLYPTLSVLENVDFFGRLFGQDRAERERRIAALLESTGLAPFAGRPAQKLSGGMKQKLGLCCALIHDPDLLILDEPTTGVDPLSRRQFWDLIASIRAARPGMSLIAATAYMEEAEGFDWLVAMDGGRVLATGTPAQLRAETGTRSLDAAFVSLLPETKRRGHTAVEIPPRTASGAEEVAIEAHGLTMRFGNFVAVDRVSFAIRRGEIFGFLGSNGCGKTTTMKMLTGLQPASEGEARLFGRRVDSRDIQIRRRVGYMSQGFSLYAELTVRQNLDLHARLFRLPARDIAPRIQEMMRRFDLEGAAETLAEALPLGVRQRLSLAVAMIHAPEILILDEPTSGVDPVARDAFWQSLVDLARRDRVTIFISTHFMNEAERCDRISLMHAGRVLVTDTPAAIMHSRGAGTLDDAFVAYLEEAAGTSRQAAAVPPAVVDPAPVRTVPRRAPAFDPMRMLSYTWRETLELRRDPIRATLALIGSVLLLLIMGYGISMDVENLSFAVLDRDQTSISRDYVLDIAGSRYFRERPPILSYEDLDRRMRAGELSLAIEIPPGFGRDLLRGRPVEIGAWFDGAMPQRAETVRAYIQGMHAHWLNRMATLATGGPRADTLFRIETRFRYNPDVASIVAMVPAILPLLLMLIPAMLTALSVVREKELGSIVNLYVTPVTRLEFLLGKQIPYIGLAMVNFLLLAVLAVTLFGVPFTGSFPAYATAALLYVAAATGFGLLVSTFMRSQIAAIFGTTILTVIPAHQFSGLTDPVASLVGLGRLIGEVYPTTHFMAISRGTFSKGLGFGDLPAELIPLLITGPVLLLLSVALLRKQAG